MSLAVVLLVAVAGLWGGEASWIQVSSPRPVPAQVDIFVNLTTEGFVFNPATIAAPPNATIHVRITQRDPVPHTFTVGMEKDRDLPRSWTPQQLDDYMRDNNLTDVFIPDVVDTVVWANFTAPAEVGRYEYVCRIGGHFQGGMFGFLLVAQEEIFVNLTTDGIRFIPDSFPVSPSAKVHVRITQKDPVPHTFTLGTEKDRDLPRSWTPQQLEDYFRNNNLTDVFIPDVVDTVVWANFTAPAEVGRYEYVCLIAGHFQGGMSGFMVVREEGLGDDGAGARIDLIQGIMIATVVFVLLFAAGYHVRAVRAHRRSR